MCLYLVVFFYMVADIWVQYVPDMGAYHNLMVMQRVSLIENY